MRIIIDGNYFARPELDVLGFTGENNGRTLTFNGLGITGASSYYFVTYNDNSEVVELEITNGVLTIPANIVALNGKTPCQVVARGTNFVRKTNLFWLNVGQSVGDVTPDGKPYIDYNDLLNKPQINGVTLAGNKTSEELHIGGGGTADRINMIMTTPTLLGTVVEATSDNNAVGG